MPRLALLALAVVLSGCGLPASDPKPSKVVARAEIKNEYAVSLFTLVVQPADAGTIELFKDKRIESGASATTATFDLPVDGSKVHFDLITTSLGQNHAFNATVTLKPGAERLAITYDYDLATAGFTIAYGTKSD